MGHGHHTSVQGEADRPFDHGARPDVDRGARGPRRGNQLSGRVHLVVVDEKRLHLVLRSEEPADGELALHHEDRPVGLELAPAGRVVEVPIVVEAGVGRIIHLDERSGRLDPGVADTVGHPDSLAYPVPAACTRLMGLRWSTDFVSIRP